MAEKQFTVLEKAKTAIILDHPFFASGLCRHPLIADPKVGTLGIDRKGQIFYNPKFVEGLTVQEAVYALCHEVLHRYGNDAVRMQGRIHKKWNVACDAYINDVLDASNIGTRIPNIVNMPGSKDKTKEDIYASLPDQPSGGQGKGKGDPSSGGQQPGKGDPNSGDGEMGDDLIDGGPIDESEAAEIAADIKVEVAQATQAAKARGKLPGALAAFAAAVIESKVPWYEHVERFMTNKVNNDFSWKRPNKRFAPDYYLPCVSTIPRMGPIALIIDISGSVSRREIAHYNGHMKRLVEQCRPEKIHVIYVDTQVHKHDEFTCDDDIEVQFYSGGGTDMCEGFRYMEREGIEVDVTVVLTDGYTPFPQQLDVPSIWCISTESIVSPVGETVHFEVVEEK